MSIKIMTAVWEHAQAQGGALLVLLALADFSNDDGECWPSVKTLAAKARISERQVQNILHDFKEQGRVRVSQGEGPYGVNVYTLNIGVKDLHQGGATQFTEGVQPTSPKPSREPSSITTTTAAGGIAAIFRLYEEHIGTLDPYIAARLTEAEEEYSRECLTHSFAEASRQNIRRWAYVEAILKAHKQEGCYVRRAKANGRGHARKGDGDALRGPDIGAWKAYAAGG